MIQLISLISPTNSYRHGWRNNLLVILFDSRFSNGFRFFGQLLRHGGGSIIFNFSHSFWFGFCFYNLWGCFRLNFCMNNRFSVLISVVFHTLLAFAFWFGRQFGFTYLFKFILFNWFVFCFFIFNHCFKNI